MGRCCPLTMVLVPCGVLEGLATAKGVPSSLGALLLLCRSTAFVSRVGVAAVVVGVVVVVAAVVSTVVLASAVAFVVVVSVTVASVVAFVVMAASVVVASVVASVAVTSVVVAFKTLVYTQWKPFPCFLTSVLTAAVPSLVEVLNQEVRNFTLVGP